MRPTEGYTKPMHPRSLTRRGLTRSAVTRAAVTRAIVRPLGVCLVSFAFCLACQKKEPEKAPEPPKPAATAAAKPAAKKPAPPPIKAVLWEDPKEWKRVEPSSSMRAASYEIPPVKGDKAPAELNVFVLGGSVDANIKRWVDEFTAFDPKDVVRVDRTVNDLSQAVVELPKGTFSGGMATLKASENYGLLGAIVSTPAEAKYFFKMTGPSATVKAARDAFYRMLDSAYLEGTTPAKAGAPGDSKAPGSAAGSAQPAGDSKPAGDTKPGSGTKPATGAPAGEQKPSSAPAGETKPASATTTVPPPETAPKK